MNHEYILKTEKYRAEYFHNLKDKYGVISKLSNPLNINKIKNVS